MKRRRILEPLMNARTAPAQRSAQGQDGDRHVKATSTTWQEHLAVVLRCNGTRSPIRRHVPPQDLDTAVELAPTSSGCPA